MLLHSSATRLDYLTHIWKFFLDNLTIYLQMNLQMNFQVNQLNVTFVIIIIMHKAYKKSPLKNEFSKGSVFT